ncbi:hypothetical protein F5X68DRAFT_272202 [Plectosphaerella plurivora]|uniref:Peptidase A1 domain-containing protein n=1 Tax=Plectosphaerella plurivora TaxID=936078 RepID=A0A9P8VMI4_9PEZI|nr:hypothetical protein F5X68DRAFT_272202 [Plectosphaerella plurivora]
MRNTHLLGSLPIIASAVAAQDGILSFPIRATAVSGGLSKRQLAPDAQSRQDGTIYTIDVSIGTPGQVVSLEIDTGSEEMWVNPICSEATYPALCAEAGRYTESSTLYDLAVDSGRLADDGYVAISYVYDTVSIGSTRIPLQIFGVPTDTERFSVGQLGLGPSPAGWESNYPYVLDNLVGSRAINSKAFSLDLGRDGSEDGALIFGGIDTSRYIGNLERISAVSASDSPDGYTRYWITSSRVGVTRDSSIALISNTPIIFHLNSGSPISALPTAAFTNLLSAFPEASPAAQFPGRYVVPCTLAEATGSIDFSFGSTVINVPLSDFIWRQPEGCYLGAYSSEMPVLGANFLRAAYVVFDWDNREVHVANSARESCEPNLVAIGSGQDAVPSVAGSCQSSTSSTVSSTSSSSSISSTSTSSTSAASTSSSISSTLSTSTLSSSTVSSTSASSTLTTSTLSSSTLTSSTLASSTLSTSTLSSSTATSSSDISSTSASSTQTSSAVSSSSSATDSSTDISSTAAPASASTTTSDSISVSTASSSTLSGTDRLGGRETIYDSLTTSLESSTSSSDSTVSSSATSSAYDGASTISLDGTIYPSDSTTSSATSSAHYPINGTTTASAASSEYNGVSTVSLDGSTISSSTISTHYGDRTAVPTYDDKVCEAETISSSSSSASPTYGATSSQPTQEVYDTETISSTSSIASPTYDARSSSSEVASSSEETYGVETESFTSAIASPTYAAESRSSETTSSSATEVPYEEKTGYRASDTASPTYDLESSSYSTSTASVSTEAPYEEKTDASTTSTASPTYGVESSSSGTTSSGIPTDKPYEEKTGHLTSLTASPTYNIESSSSEASSSYESTEIQYEEKTDTSSAVYISSTDVPSYGNKAPYSAVPIKEPYKSDDYRDIPTITTVLTTTTTAPHYDTVTSAPLDETTTITTTATSTYTITACSKDDPYCTVGGVTTKVVTRLTTICPEKTTATTSTASTSTSASASDVSDYELHQSTSTKTSSIVTLVTSKTCTESAAYRAPTTSAIYEDMGHHGYGSGPQDDVYHEEEARNDGPDSDPIYNHDEFAYQDKPSTDGYSQPSPASTHPYRPGSSIQPPSPTKYNNTPAHSSASPVYTEPVYEHVTAGASAGGVPLLLILCVGILTVLLMQ